MKTLLEAFEPNDPKYAVLDGRHRLVAAAAKGVPEMRCDVLTVSTQPTESRGT